MFNFANKMLNALVGNEEGGQQGGQQGGPRPPGQPGIPRPQGQGSWMAAPGATGQMSGTRMPGQNIQGFGGGGMSSFPSTNNMQGGQISQMGGMANASMTSNMGGPGAPGSTVNQPGTSGPGMTGPGMGGPGMGGPGMTGLGMSAPGMGGPGMSGPGMGGPGMGGPGMTGPGMSGPGMTGPGMGGPGMTGPGMSGPGAMNRPPNMMGPRPPQHGPMNHPMGRGGPPRPGMGPGMRGMPPGGPRGPGGPGMMPGIVPRPGMGPMGPRGPMSMNGHTPRPIRPGIPGQGPQMTQGGMMMGPRPTIVEPTSSTPGGGYGQKIQQDPLHRSTIPQDIKASLQLQGKNPNVDLSELSAEERAIIENVMAKAQEMDSSGMPKTGLEPHRDLQNSMAVTKCVLCRTQDSIPGQNCIDCHILVCKGCSEVMPAIENKRNGLVCVNCASHRKSIVSNVHQINQTVPNYQLNQSQSPYSHQKQQNQQGYSMNAQQQSAIHPQQQSQSQLLQSQQLQNQQIQGQQFQNQEGQHLQNQSLQNQNQHLQNQQMQNQPLQDPHSHHMQNQQLQNQSLQNQQLQNQSFQNQQLQNPSLQNQQLQNHLSQNQQLLNQQGQNLQNQQNPNLPNQHLQTQQNPQLLNQQNQGLQNQNLQNQQVQHPSMQQHPMQHQSQQQPSGTDAKYTPFQQQMDQIAAKSQHDGRESSHGHGNISQQANIDNAGQYKTSPEYRRAPLKSQTSLDGSYPDGNAPGMFRGPADGQDNKVISQPHGMVHNQGQHPQFPKPGHGQINQNVAHSASMQQGQLNQGPPPVYINNVMQSVPGDNRPHDGSHEIPQGAYNQQNNPNQSYQLQQSRSPQNSLQTQNHDRGYPENPQFQTQVDMFGQNIQDNRQGSACQKVGQPGTAQNFPASQQQNQSNQHQNYMNKPYSEDVKTTMHHKPDPTGHMHTSQDPYSSQTDPFYQNTKMGQQSAQHGISQASNLASQQNHPHRTDGSGRNQQAPGFGGISNFLGLQKGKTGFLSDLFKGKSDETAYRQQNQSQFGNDPHMPGVGPQNTQNHNYQNNLNQSSFPQTGIQRQVDQYQNMYPIDQQGGLSQKNQGGMSSSQQQIYAGPQQQMNAQTMANQQMNIQPQHRQSKQGSSQQVTPLHMQNAVVQQRPGQDPHLYPNHQNEAQQFGQQQMPFNQSTQPLNYQDIDGNVVPYNSNMQHSSQQPGTMYSNTNQVYGTSQLQPTSLAVQHGQQHTRSMPLSPTDPKQMLAAAGMANRLRQTSDARGFSNQLTSGAQHPNLANQQPKSSISGMLSDFTKALGLSGTSPKEENKLLVDHLGAGVHSTMGTGMQHSMGMHGIHGQPTTGVHSTMGPVGHMGVGMQQTMATGMPQVIGTRIQNPINVAMQHPMGPVLHQSKNQQKLINHSRGQDDVALGQNYSTQNIIQPHAVLAAQNQTMLQQSHIPQSSDHNLINTNYTIANQHIGNKTGDIASIAIPGQVISTTMVNQAGQPVIVQQIAPVQAAQLQQQKVLQQQQNLKAFKNRDQANVLLQQQALMQQMQQDKFSQQNSRKDLIAGTMSGGQQIGNKLALFPPTIPTAALLSQSTLATSESKQRGTHVSESPLASLQRSQIARQASLDGTSTGSSYSSGILGNARSSSSLTNLNNISKAPDIILPTRPGSALGLLRSKTSSTGGYTTGGPQLKTGLPTCIASLLPPDLHHLIYTNTNTYSSAEALLTAKLREELKSSGSDRRALLEAELRKIQDERRRYAIEKERETDLKLRSELDRLSSINYAGPLSMKQRNVIQRRLGMQNSMFSPLAPSPKLKRKGHQRQMSDPKIFSSMSPLRDDRQYYSNEYLRPQWDSSLRGSKSNYLEEEDVIMARQAGFHSAYRRNSESGMATDYWDRPLTPQSLYEYSTGGVGKHKHGRRPRKPRSWHPSPYASDDDDDMYSREEKKQQIKAEIARRRQQIEENSRLHEELLRLARLRENAEHGYYDVRALNFDQSPAPSTKDSTSVLRSIDEILRDVRDPSAGYYGHSNYKQASPTNKYTGVMSDHRQPARHYYGPHGQPPRYPLTEEDKSIARLASTFPPREYGDYGISNYGRISDLSPLPVGSLNDYTPAMPLLPDMPTRSRKLLEDLGSSPIAAQNQRDGSYRLQRSNQELLATSRRDFALSSMRARANVSHNRYYSAPSRKIERGTSLEHLNTNSRALHYYSHDNLDYEHYSAGQRRWSDDYSYGERYVNSTWNNPSNFNYMDKYDDGYELALHSPNRNRKSFNGRDDMTRYPHDQDRRLHYQNSDPIRDARYDYYDTYDVDNQDGYYPDDMRAHSNERKMNIHNPNLRRICLSRDPKDKKISGNGIGMKVIGGKEIPNSHGRLGAYVAKITPGGVVAALGEFKEGDLIVEWNGISLLDKTHEEIQKVLNQTADEIEVEIAIRSDINMLRGSSSTNKSNNNSRRASLHSKQLEENDKLRSRDRTDRSEKGHRGRLPLEDKTIMSNLDYNANESSKLDGNPIHLNSYPKDHDISDEYYRERQRSFSDKENRPRRDRYPSVEDEYQLNSSDSRGNGYSKDPDYLRGEKGDRRRRRRRSFEKDPRQKSHERNQSADSRHLGRNIIDDHTDAYNTGVDVRRYDPYEKGDFLKEGDLNDRNTYNPDHYYNEFDGRKLNDESRRHYEGDSHIVKDEYKNHSGLSSNKDKRNSRGQSDGRDHSTRSHRSHHSSRQKSRNSHHKSSKSDPNQPPLGMIELQICYDSVAKILYVTVIRAKGLLTLKDDGGTQPDPFVKVYLLPGRSIENQRRTRFVANTSTPEWNQTMVYPNLQAADFKKRYLEVTAWSYAKNKPNEFLGETVLDLSDSSVVDEDPKWYQLQEMVDPDGSQIGPGSHQ